MLHFISQTLTMQTLENCPILKRLQGGQASGKKRLQVKDFLGLP